MCRDVGGTTRVETLKFCEAVMGFGSFHVCLTLVTHHLDDAELGIECVHLGCNVKYVGVCLMVPSHLHHQFPVIDASCSLHGLMVGHQLLRYGVDVPHGEGFGGLINGVVKNGIECVLEYGVVWPPQGAIGGRDEALTQSDVMGLLFDTVVGGEGEVGESSVILLEPLRAFRVWLARDLGMQVSELLVKLLDIFVGFQLLEGVAKG
jgi:hypothetical protein